MRGVLALCLLYVGAPVVLLWVLSVASSGFPLAPFAIAAAFYWQFQQSKGSRRVTRGRG